MGRLTTHVLDTASGIPARNMKLSLYQITHGQRTLFKETQTNNDGRCDAPLLEGPTLKKGQNPNRKLVSIVRISDQNLNAP